ncbi:sensor histidine kinase [Paracoccus sp. SCSIO 75233]|uniref:sensor histidine kinase n=1 Tax=Paracoccus sp. SCSIO 75233 TaxID=3017782 RepID=UPI0022F065FC|nr:sensor histidine kinase [Paracoccus sp. SCSIO 75233]WBU52095.1 sensor histidine kinase [Paracoccus sp. SCSIO 75233]
MIGWNSIRGRLLWLSAIWLSVALLAAYLVIGSVLERFVESRFDADSAAIADSLMAGTQADDQGLAQIYDAPGDPRFSAPLSGWYWQLDADGAPVAVSDSLYDGTLPTGEEATGIAGQAPDGASLRLLRRSYTVPGSKEALSVTVTAPQAEIDAAMSSVQRPLALTLMILGLGLALAVLLQVTSGLSALKIMGRNLRHIRSGKADGLPRPNAAELQPVADEINALISQNRDQLARTREQIGNLAHSLKTPLMALQGEMAPDDPRQAVITRMDRQIAWHLKQARSAGGRQVLGQRTELGPVVDDIALVLRRMLEDRGITIQKDIPDEFTVPLEQQDTQEILGNLLENAAKWATSKIMVRARASDRQITLTISDDGPGMADADHARALSRGTRLDERGPGAGLGLAIVADLAALNGGALKLGRDDALGGLSARITLPNPG